MAPTRKTRSVNKRFTSVNEVSPSKDGKDLKKSTQRKRKLSDMLGSQWSKEELERFYEAHRKYGKDWKKVAAVVRNRSMEMVEALYTMNKAYLSLPEGTASVVGLIAMMTDHYSNLDRSDSEHESNDGIVTSDKPQKYGQGKYLPNSSKGSDGRFLSHSQPVASSSGCLSLVKKRQSGGSRPRPVGKRTPRFPVSYPYDKFNREKFLSPTRQGLKRKVDVNADDVAQEVALALAEASQQGVFPQVSHTPNRRPSRRGEWKRAALELTSAKLRSEIDEDDFEGSMEAHNEDVTMERNDLVEIQGHGTAETRRGRGLNVKMLEANDSANNNLDDIKEACSRTEGCISAFRATLESEVMDGKAAKSSSHVSRKKSKKVLSTRDEEHAFDALQTLADLSLMMPATVTENESSVQLKEEEDLVETHHQRDRRKYSGVKGKGNRIISGFEASPRKTSKLGKVSVLDVSAIPEAKEDSQQASVRISRKKQKMLASKIPNIEAHESQQAEARDAEKKLLSKGKRSSYKTSQQKRETSVSRPEHLASSTNPRGVEDDSALSTVRVPIANQVTKVRSRRKMEPEKLHNPKDLKRSDKFPDNKYNLPIPSIHDGALNLKEKLSNCLSNRQLRRWCAFEWFYSATDYPWFAKREFVEYLNHVGLGNAPRLTRVEWGVIRSSLGKPRRFSEQFLREEKEKLNQFRKSVRTHYTELHAGTREGLPTDLARPLSVGQRVLAIHPRTREIHDGSVLTVDHTRCRAQFDRPELGVEFVLDIDCMPLKPLDDLPSSLARKTVAIDNFVQNLNEQKINGQAKDQKPEERDVPSNVSPSTYPQSNLLKAKGAPINFIVQAKFGSKESANNQQAENSESSIRAQIQAKEADAQALAELTRALDRKEAVVSELRYMNDDALQKQKDGDKALKDSEPFRKQYAAVLVQLNEVNEEVSSALCSLRQQNTYQGNSLRTWLGATDNLGGFDGSLSSFYQPANNAEESGSHVHETVEDSRIKAQTMVDAAMQAMSSLKGGGNTIERIEEAIDYVSNRLSLDDSCTVTMIPSTPTDQINGSSASQAQWTSCTVSSLHAPELNLNSRLKKNEAQITSELISHCVATLLMIQKCTERQFPPADVAEILESAVTSLQPCCSQNLPVYAEIEKCMGIIRNQILALIPT